MLKFTGLLSRGTDVKPTVVSFAFNPFFGLTIILLQTMKFFPTSA